MNKRPKNRLNDEGMIVDKDRISQMPEHIIHEILSYLPAKDVARIGILSKTFRHAGDSVPFFDFDQYDFDTGLKLAPLTDEEEEKYMVQSANKHFNTEADKNMYMKKLRNKEHFLEYLDKALKRVRELLLPIKVLRLWTKSSEGELIPRIDQWIGLASRYVQELILGFGGKEAVYSLPQTIIAAKSLTHLTLTNCRLDQPLFRNTCLKFSNLRELSLAFVFIDEQVIQNFTRCCPLIEILSFNRCSGLKYYQVYGLHKLKKVEVVMKSVEVGNVEVVAPILEHLKYGSPVRFHSLPPSTINVDGCCKSLKKLSLTGTIITDHLFQDMFSKVPLLETLSLKNCHKLERIKISSDRLRKLKLSCLKLVAAAIDTPNLHDLQFLTDVTCFLTPGNVPEQTKVAITIISVEEKVDNLWFLRVREYLSTFKKISCLTMSLPSPTVALSPKELREMSIYPPPEVWHLKLIPFESKETDFSCFLDCLLWSFHPYAISLSVHPGCCHEFIKFLYEKLRNHRARNHRAGNCCDNESKESKCWRHYLKGVNIKRYGGRKEKTPLEIWFYMKWYLIHT